MLPRPWLLPLILGAMSAFGPLATDMYLPAFPAIAAGLPADPAAVQGTLAAFFAGMAAAQLFYGPLADRLGRKPPLLLGLAIFTLASLGCAVTSDIGTLTWLRFGQGLGGCAGMVMARAIVRDLAEGPAAIRLMAQLGLVQGLAPILAPSIGSALLGVGSWRLIFWVLAAYAAALAVVVVLAAAGDPGAGAAPTGRPGRHPAHLSAAAAGPAFPRPYAGGGAADGRDVRLYRQLALRLHGAVRRLAAALRPVLRRRMPSAS